jgi:hypothetical protein
MRLNTTGFNIVGPTLQCVGDGDYRLFQKSLAEFSTRLQQAVAFSSPTQGVNVWDGEFFF